MTAHASSFLTCAASKSPFQLSILGVISGVFRLCKRRNFALGKNLPGRTTVRYCHVSGCAISYSTAPFNCHEKPLICTLQQRPLDFSCSAKFSSYYLLEQRNTKTEVVLKTNIYLPINTLQQRNAKLEVASKFSSRYISRTYAC